MPNGMLTTPMQKALEKVVRGRVVTDLGAGDLGLARELLKLGAKSIVAVDKEFPRGTRSTKKIRLVRAYYANFTEDVDVAFVSWPANWTTPGLIEAVERSGTVIYLGKNTDGAACGTPELFANLSFRKPIAYIPDRRNTLIIYGPDRIKRPLYGEEWVALQSDLIHFEDLPSFPC